jgi:hypothetical protein
MHVRVRLHLLPPVVCFVGFLTEDAISSVNVLHRRLFRPGGGGVTGQGVRSDVNGSENPVSEKKNRFRGQIWTSRLRAGSELVTRHGRDGSACWSVLLPFAAF